MQTWFDKSKESRPPASAIVHLHDRATPSRNAHKLTSTLSGSDPGGWSQIGLKSNFS